MYQVQQLCLQPVRRPTMARPASNAPLVRASRMCMCPSPAATVKGPRASRIALQAMPLCVTLMGW